MDNVNGGDVKLCKLQPRAISSSQLQPTIMKSHTKVLNAATCWLRSVVMNYNIFPNRCHTFSIVKQFLVKISIPLRYAYVKQTQNIVTTMLNALTWLCLNKYSNNIVTI